LSISSEIRLILPG